jgi:hypothetical protein
MLEKERPKYWTSPKDGDHAASAVSETGFTGVYRPDRSASLSSSISRRGHDGEYEPEPVKPLLWTMVSTAEVICFQFEETFVVLNGIEWRWFLVDFFFP